jgi:hypothetical protein
VLISLQPAVVLAALLLQGGASTVSAPAAVQEPAATQGSTPAREQAAPPSSLDRTREAVTRTPALKLEAKPPTPTFRTTVEGRALMLPFQEYLRQQLEPTPLQRQSREWASQCCGIDLGRLFNGLEKALERRKVRQVRDQISRELAELEAARAK